MASHRPDYAGEIVTFFESLVRETSSKIPFDNYEADPTHRSYSSQPERWNYSYYAIGSALW